MHNPNEDRTMKTPNVTGATDRIEAIHRQMPLRIATTYFVFSLLWIVVTAGLGWNKMRSEQGLVAFFVNSV